MKPTGKVAFSSGYSSDFDIWTLDLASGSLQQVTSGDSFNDYPRWSPDGKLIAFVSTGQDSIASLWVMNADGSDKRRLTSRFYCQHPSWSPSGESIIFVSNGVDKGEIDVCSMNLDGSGLKRLFGFSGIESAPSYSPDGDHIIYATTQLAGGRFALAGSTDIVEFSIKEETHRAIHSHPANDFGPRYSPDGSLIAFMSHRNEKTVEEYQAEVDQYREILRCGSNAEGRAAMQRMKKFQEDGDIYISSRDGTQLRPLTQDRHADRSLCWSPCGNFILYSRTSLRDPSADRLHLIDVQSGKNIPFPYNRSALEREIGADQLVNRTWFQRMTPDALERMMIDASFWGAERNPDWTR